MAKMTAEEIVNIGGLYYDQFEDNIDARRMSPDRFAQLPELMKMALKRGSGLTLEELGIEGEVPLWAVI
jgi:hypothetical protein